MKSKSRKKERKTPRRKFPKAKITRKARPQRRPVEKPLRLMKENSTRQVIETPLVREPEVKKDGLRISVDEIDGDIVIGDLIVVFPRTREVLRKHGLMLDVEHAGDIYMTIEAFAALQSIKTPALIQELMEASKESPPPAPQTIPELVSPPTA